MSEDSESDFKIILMPDNECVVEICWVAYKL